MRRDEEAEKTRIAVRDARDAADELVYLLDDPGVRLLALRRVARHLERLIEEATEAAEEGSK